ncbi:hypothetical protein V5J53_004510 [Salmonella enterica]
MKNENRNMQDVLQKIMYSRLIGYLIILIFFQVILIMSARIPALNDLMNKVSSTDAINYMLLFLLLLEMITYLTYGIFIEIKRKRVKKELDLIVKGYSEGFNDGCKYQSKKSENHD